MKQNILLFFFILFVTCSYTQNNVSYNIENGVEGIEQQYIDAWKKVKKIDGFRIQITSFSGPNSKTAIENVAEQFKQQFPEAPFKISYVVPNFILRVGNFTTKLEASKALQKIAPLFPGAFVVKDQIDFK